MSAVTHPSDLKRVSVDSVREVLAQAGVSYAAVRSTPKNGVVRVEVTGWPGARLATARERICKAFDGLRVSDYWGVSPTGRTYPGRPWRTWVTIRDPGTDWHDGGGRDFLGNRW